MKNQRGYAHWVIVILISVMAVGLVGAAWYYEKNKENTTTTTNANKTTNQSANNTTNTNTDINVNTAVVANSNINSAINTNSNTNKEGSVFFTTADEHGCIASVGQTWCEEKEKCLKSWEEECLNIDDWQTYTNSQYNYSIQYPPNWTVDEDNARINGFNNEGTMLLADENTYNDIFVYFSEDGLSNGPIEPFSIDINNINATYGIEYGMVNYKSVVYPKDNGYIELTWQAGFRDDIIQQTIISTFKFTD